MNFIKKRRSIRKYKSIPVPKNDIDKIIKAGIFAPSAKNRPPWKYSVYSGTEKDKLLNEMEKGLIRERDGEKLLPDFEAGLPDAFNTLKIMRQAPVLIIILNTNGYSPYRNINAEERITEICDTLSIGASVQNMLLTAAELGYGTLWIANTCFAYKELVNFIGASYQLAGAVALGVPDEQPPQRPRKKFEDIVEYR